MWPCPGASSMTGKRILEALFNHAATSDRRWRARDPDGRLCWDATRSLLLAVRDSWTRL
jgi:hypothetical protein